MPASSTGALPVSSVNAVRTLSPAEVWMMLGAKRVQFWVRSGRVSSVESSPRSATVEASTTPTPVPWATVENSLPTVVPGPKSNTHRALGSVDFMSARTRAAQSTWLSSTSAASSRAWSALIPQDSAHETACETASAISGLWNGRVTSRYSSTGSNTRPPRTFSSRSLAWCLCSLTTSTPNAARSSG
ncbi:unknown [Bifidobacterium pseudocatenulatum CAG:263]|nr:unknown [Bifidobacterium pseudocatenulatum CAG:263]